LAVEDGFVPGKSLFEVVEAAEKSTIVMYLLSDAGQSVILCVCVCVCVSVSVFICVCVCVYACVCVRNTLPKLLVGCHSHCISHTHSQNDARSHPCTHIFIFGILFSSNILNCQMPHLTNDNILKETARTLPTNLIIRIST